MKTQSKKHATGPKSEKILQPVQSTGCSQPLPRAGKKCDCRQAWENMLLVPRASNHCVASVSSRKHVIDSSAKKKKKKRKQKQNKKKRKTLSENKMIKMILK